MSQLFLVSTHPSLRNATQAVATLQKIKLVLLSEVSPIFTKAVATDVVIIDKATIQSLQLVSSLLDLGVRVVIWVPHHQAASTDEFLRLGVLDIWYFPCSQRELASKCALLAIATRPTVFGCTYDAQQGKISNTLQVAWLSKLENQLLSCLAATPQMYVTRDHLLEAVWPVGAFASNDALDVLIRRLRLKLRVLGLEILNRRGFGYKVQASFLPAPSSD